jgi:Ca2+-binding EF-hand superfamily protein
MAVLQNRSEKQFLAQCVRRLGVGGAEFISLSMFDDILHSVLKIHWSHDQIRRVFQLHLEKGAKGKISISKLAEEVSRKRNGGEASKGRRRMGQSKSLPTIRMDNEQGSSEIRSEIKELEAQLVLTKRLQKLQERMEQFD